MASELGAFDRISIPPLVTKPQLWNGRDVPACKGDRDVHPGVIWVCVRELKIRRYNI